MDRDSVKKRIKDLRDEIEYHNKLYYDDNQNIISDYEYDLKMNELISLEKQYPEYLLNTSPSLKVGGKITKDFIHLNIIPKCYLYQILTLMKI